MKIINLTAHDINEVTTGTTIPKSGIVARVKASTSKIRAINGMPVYCSTFGGLEGLPTKVKNTVYVVSGLALNEVPKDRDDVVAPGNVQRSETGEILGCVGFRTKW